MIGVLAAITIVSYSGISNKAIAAGLQSDLDGSAKQLKMYYVDHGVYPSSLDSNNCPLNSSGEVDIRYCLKASGSNIYDYSPINFNSPTGFNLTSSNSGGMVYAVNNDSTPNIINSNITAMATPTIATGGYLFGIAMSADGTSVHVADWSWGGVRMYSRDT